MLTIKYLHNKNERYIRIANNNLKKSMIELGQFNMGEVSLSEKKPIKHLKMNVSMVRGQSLLTFWLLTLWIIPIMTKLRYDIIVKSNAGSKRWISMG